MDLTGKHYTWFQNRECEYFPCHKGVREEEFNCLFCYCPLYRHPNCRGSFVLRDGIYAAAAIYLRTAPTACCPTTGWRVTPTSKPN